MKFPIFHGFIAPDSGAAKPLNAMNTAFSLAAALDAQLSVAIGALQMGVLMREFGGSFARAGAVVTLIYVLGLGLIWLAPETKGRPLPA